MPLPDAAGPPDPRHPDVVLQHALGALVGAAVGDALGAPFEFHGPGRWSETFPVPVLGGTGELRAGGPWAAGEFTDDTQMAVVLAESLLACGGLDPVDVWRRWRRWAATAADVGVLTRAALAHPGPDGAAARAHTTLGGRSAGNGTIMRDVPVALFTLDRPVDEAVGLAVAQAGLTHLDPHTHVGAALHVAMVRAWILGGDPDAAVSDLLDTQDPVLADRWRVLLAPAWTPIDATTGNGTVWTCLAQAVWAVRHADSFADAVTRAVDLGDDADTVACVAGALAGARFGIQAIPSRWTTYLHGTVDTDDGPRRSDAAALQDLGRRLLGRSSAPPGVPERAKPPVRIHDDVPVHAADWKGAAGVPTDWAVVSLCRVHGDFAHHPVRREVYLIDRYAESDNHDPLAALTDAVEAIDAFLAEDPDRPVVVHCHGGHSRTGFVLKAWAMRRHGWDEERAHAWLAERWPHVERNNPVFVRVLREDWHRG